MKHNPDPSVKFNARDVKRVLKLVGITSDFIHNDGGSITVLAGHGEAGLRRADTITTIFPFWDSRIVSSERAGASVAQLIEWDKAGVSKSHYVVFELPEVPPKTLGEAVERIRLRVRI